MKSCVITPTVLNKEGKSVPSKLYKGLLVATDNNRDLALYTYNKLRSENFKNDWYSKLTLDEYGQPTIDSILKDTNVMESISESTILKSLNKKIGYYKKVKNDYIPSLYSNNDSNYSMLLSKAKDFNLNSEFKNAFEASVVKIPDDKTNKVYIGVKVQPKIPSLVFENKESMEYNESLNKRLRDILASKGVSIGVLTDLEKRMKLQGVTDFSVSKDIANGLIELIRIAEGIKGEKALPEEFAHTALAMLSGHPLVKRLINNITDNNLIEEILGKDYNTYTELYEGNVSKLAEEAAGKLLAKHLLKQEQIPSKSYSTLLNRVIDAIKSFLRSFNSSDIQKAIYEADKEFGILAKDILMGNLDDQMDISNITSSELFYKTQENVNRDKNIVKKIITTEYKRYQIYKERTASDTFDIEQQVYINKLETLLKENEENEAIYTFIQSALKNMKYLEKKLSKMDKATTIKEKASVLRDVRNYLFSYGKLIDNIGEEVRRSERDADNRFNEKIKISLQNTSLLMDTLWHDYNDLTMPLFVKFLTPFIGDTLEVTYGKNKGKKFTVQELLETAEQDVSLIDFWLDSMADSSDQVLRVLDKVVKDSKESARLQTIDTKTDLIAALVELEQSGIKDTSWMFEVDSKGNKSGNYIQDINYALYKEKQREMYKNLENKYGKNPIGDNLVKYKKERAEWYRNNVEEGTYNTPKRSIYENTVYKNLTPAQKKYYDTIKEIKTSLDNLLPPNYTTFTNAVKIRKDLTDRVLNAGGVQNAGKEVWESIKDSFLKRSDDSEFGAKAALQDFEGREVQTVPIYYTKLRPGESTNDISTDVTSTMIAYAAMVYDYNEINKVVDILEIGRDILNQRDIKQTDGEKALTETIKQGTEKVYQTLTKKGAGTNFIDKLNSFYEMQIYGRYMKDEGTFGNTKINKGKTANFLNKLTALTSTALSPLSALANVTTGTAMLNIEAMSKEFFTPSNLLVADRNYASSLPSLLANINNKAKDDKLSLFIRLFNTSDDHEQQLKDLNLDKKNWVFRMFNTKSLFFMSNAGEHWLQTRGALALADAYKVKDNKGKTTNLWEALEVVYKNPNNKKLGADLKIKQGYTQLDGKEITQKDLIRFGRKARKINQGLFGIYNSQDKSAAQQFALGRLAIMYRKWIVPQMNKRWRRKSFDYDLETTSEGYYRTAGAFILQLSKDLRAAQFNLVASWNELDKADKANIRRAFTEIGQFMILTAALGLADWDDDDDDSTWTAKMIEYQARRLKTELGVLLPEPLTVLREGLKLIQAPAVGVRTAENLLNLIKACNPMNYELVRGEDAVLQSGRYKGYSKAQKALLESPLLPTYRTLNRTYNIEETIEFYKN